MASRYTIYAGKFICQACKEEVASMRHYPEDEKLTWMCRQNHMSAVQLTIKKTKRDYEREK